MRLTKDSITPAERASVRRIWTEALTEGRITRSHPRIHPLEKSLETSLIVAREMGLRRSSVIAALLFNAELLAGLPLEQVEQDFGPSTAGILRGLQKVSQLKGRQVAVDNDNFRNLLLSFAQDGRVILILIAAQVYGMRHLELFPLEEQAQLTANAGLLYAPLAHRMGLYASKTELEDLSLKFTQPVVFDEITRKLAESKQVREQYIARFIEPIRAKIAEVLDLPFEIKGRTKSVHSIWNKIKKQQISFEDIYDIFAIRVIIDAPPEREKASCWLVYSVVTDMYRPNPARTRDWLSIPKSNGYESLHTTVLGPEDKWVEVQIRTTRMNEVAEKGLAAHWRYKGIRGEKGIDEMLTRIRDVLEAPDSQLLDDFKMELAGDEIYVFTPKGDLHKLPAGASVLDFAYSIHTRLGGQCVGAKVNDRNVPIRHRLKSGDTVEIQTSANQVPKQDWLNCVVTSRARSKIKQSLKENLQKLAEFGRDNLARRLKNRKVELDDATLMKLVRRFKMQHVTDFYAAIGDGRLDVNQVIDAGIALQATEKPAVAPEVAALHSADKFEFDPNAHVREDVLVIGPDLKGIDFKLAQCCHPIYGDDVFGFVSVTGGIKVHRTDCPNAPQMRQRYGYRMVKARWAGQAEGSQYAVTLQVIGKDDIAIVTNITSLISKESNVSLRSIRIDSTDGLFRGYLTLMVQNTKQLDAIIKKIQTVKGVKQIIRD